MRWLVLPVALCAVSPAAHAMDPSLRGFYIGGAVGDATVEFEDDQTGEQFDADDTGYKIIVGYRIIDWVAVEVNYSDYGNPVDNYFGLNRQVSYDATSVSALGMLPLGSFDLFGPHRDQTAIVTRRLPADLNNLTTVSFDTEFEQVLHLDNVARLHVHINIEHGNEFHNITHTERWWTDQEVRELL